MAITQWKRWTVMAGLLCACGCSKLTYERWQTIDVGTATPEAVKATLGEPMTKADETWVYNDPDRDITAIVNFKGNKVVKTEWTDPTHSMETRGDQPLQPGETDQLHIQRRK